MQFWGFTDELEQAENKLEELQAKYPDFYYKLITTEFEGINYYSIERVSVELMKKEN